jgi:hypothetical protein
MPKSDQRRTHFEQVPVEIVKEIADEDLQDSETSEALPHVEPPARKHAEFPPLRHPRRMSCNTPLTDRAAGRGKWTAIERV